MIALDTNILVRYFAEDDDRQTPLARRLLEDELTAGDPGFVSLVTLVELCWVLIDVYKIDRAVQKEIIAQMIEVPNIVVERDALVSEALKLEHGDVADCIIHLLGRDALARKTLTFDKKFARLEGVELLL